MTDKIKTVLDKLKPVVKVLRQAVDIAEGAIPAAEMLIEATDASGPEAAAKKAQLVTALQVAIDEPGGLDCPEALKPYEPMILAAGIGAIILLLRKGNAGFKTGS